MKVAILGASGIIGQHMRLCRPLRIDPIWVRRKGDLLHIGLELARLDEVSDFLESIQPDVILNLAGESRPDVVERHPTDTYVVNTALPKFLTRWCQAHGKHYMHVSTQAVFSGDDPPYFPGSERRPINIYGHQKAEAEAFIEKSGGDWTIIRPTFILGIRPLPCIGRSNPIEQMLAGQEPQVCDRWFSVLFARDAAQQLWKIIERRPQGILHLGISGCTNRYEIGRRLGCVVSPVKHESFPGIAPRPINTAYGSTDLYKTELGFGLRKCIDDWYGKTFLDLDERAREIALFWGLREDEALARLAWGFGPAHAEVAEDFRAANPQDDRELLAWYRQTESYIWELSAYHCDMDFNYIGMCKGIADRLKAAGIQSVLCLGDGIGDLTLYLHSAGFNASYNDLVGSQTAKFAEFRFWMRTGRYLPSVMNMDWSPDFNGCRYFDAVVACDILEHVPNVPEWVGAIRQALVPGGLLMAQNGFAIGSGPGGSIPMHLARNDRFEKDWDPMLRELGFQQQSSNWYQKL